MPESPKLDPGFHKEIFTIIDPLRALRTDPSSFSVDDYRKLLGHLCGALNASLEHGFDLVVRYVSDLTLDANVRAEAKGIVSNAETFLKFIKFEEDALVSCGASKESAKAISLEIAGLREQLIELPYDAGRVLDSVKTGRNAICRAAEEIKSSLDKEIEHFQDAKRTMFAYGIAASVANAAATAISVGAAAPFAALSLSASGILILVRGALRDPATRRPLKP
jgi:hypothetical protein